MADVHDERRWRRAAPPEGLLLSPTLRPSAPAAEWFHHCSACGKCCNSPPELSLAELFQHQELFLGCLAIRRVRLPNASVAQRALADRLLHPLTTSPNRIDWIQLVTLGFDDGTRAACPALDVENRCSLHAQGKPGACRAVPLDPWRADDEQADVLHFRAKDARSWGTDCISAKPEPAFRPLTRGLRVVDTGAVEALAERRRELEQEKLRWGRAVFSELSAELFSKPERVAALPEAGFFVISLAPVLLTVVRASSAAHARVVEYLDAQARVAARMVARAKSSSAELRQLYALADTNARLRQALRAQR